LSRFTDVFTRQMAQYIPAFLQSTISISRIRGVDGSAYKKLPITIINYCQMLDKLGDGKPFCNRLDFSFVGSIPEWEIVPFQHPKGLGQYLSRHYPGFQLDIWKYAVLRKAFFGFSEETKPGV